MSVQKIYYVEDERDLADIIKKYLIKEGYDVTVFSDGDTAMKHIEDDVDLWILDINLSTEISGYDLIKAIKDSGSLARVIFTSARDRDLDKILGFELGSDDYLAKPYSNRELILRVKAVLKRYWGSYAEEGNLTYETYDINLTKREVYENNVLIKLTNREFDLLLFFLNHRKEAFDRDVILREIWGIQYTGNDRVVDDLLRRLRKKMEKLRIETLYGYGYRLL